MSRFEVPLCHFCWPLLDPSPDDLAVGITHVCKLPKVHGGDHQCVCGARPADNDDPHPVHRSITYGGGQ